MTDLMRRAGSHPRLALHRKRVRSGSSADLYALLAWEYRVLALANASPPATRFNPEQLDETWFKKLAQQSRAPDGPVRARKHLEAAGISVVIEPHLPSTHLDGAALLGEKGPVIGLTLRYDRLDNFWFVLFHELIHVKVHLKRGHIEDIFDDLEAEADPLEREADDLAGRALIPDEVWETALARYLRTEDSIKSLADELKIGEAIIAGRIRKEADNYIILTELVGAGKVRHQFPEVQFGQ
jgi:HTH-type transcriptional regulator/antitoxin HigA